MDDKPEEIQWFSKRVLVKIEKIRREYAECRTHVHTRRVRVKTLGGSYQVRMYCTHCKHLVGSALKQIPNDDLLDLMDQKFFNNRYEEQQTKIQKLINGEKKRIERFKKSEPKTTKIDYENYIKSEAWYAKRAKVLERDKYICQGCGGTATQVHHKTYKNLGEEFLFELMSVCKPCHERIHGIKKKLK